MLVMMVDERRDLTVLNQAAPPSPRPNTKMFKLRHSNRSDIDKILKM
jgi:hypothetical protein